MPQPTPVDDETTVVVTSAAACAPIQVWDVLVSRTAEWWGEPYLSPHDGFMRLEPELGGRLWSGASDASTGQLHGTVRAFDPPERLEIGSVLVPGAYAGNITITIEKTALGSEIRVEQMARGRIDESTEERIALGWTQMATALADLAER
ncbi:MAG: SRPBCC domain-containing protein [Acidimicrobiales bacterium]